MVQHEDNVQSHNNKTTQTNSKGILLLLLLLIMMMGSDTDDNDFTKGYKALHATHKVASFLH